MGATREKALERNGLGAFLLADYPYRLGYGEPSKKRWP
jgi:hypothetical protein